MQPGLFLLEDNYNAKRVYFHILLLPFFMFLYFVTAICVCHNNKKDYLLTLLLFFSVRSVPGPVVGFSVDEIGSNHVRISWLPTLEPNGIITGYAIRCEPSEVFSRI